MGRKQLSEIVPDVFSSQLMRKAREHLVSSFHDPLAASRTRSPRSASSWPAWWPAPTARMPASGPNLRLSFLQLEQRRIDRELRRASEAADRPRQDELAVARQDVRREMDAVMGQMA